MRRDHPFSTTLIEPILLAFGMRRLCSVRQRAGVESNLPQGIGRIDLRQSRYLG
jgi:hypothetical protein